MSGPAGSTRQTRGKAPRCQALYPTTPEQADERSDRLALTCDAVRRELCRGPLVFRCSGMEAEEGTFLACAFRLVEASALLGEHGAAVQRMDAPLAATSGNLGLLHEQINPGTGAMLGNVPQALSHLALVDAALAVDEGGG